MRLENKVAIVTGAASGIGLAIATRFAAEGARVVLADLDEAKAQAAASALNAGAVGVRCDVSEDVEVQATCQMALNQLGGLDIVVNNAGMMKFKMLADFSGDDWRAIFVVDLMGAVYFTRQLLSLPKAHRAIVNVASVHAVRTTPNVAPYAAAKAALLSLTRSTAIEGKAVGLRANAVLPGAIDTPMLWTNPNVVSGVEVIDRAQVGQPNDIASAALFLASDEAGFVTGSCLNVDGGRLAAL